MACRAIINYVKHEAQGQVKLFHVVTHFKKMPWQQGLTTLGKDEFETILVLSDVALSDPHSKRIDLKSREGALAYKPCLTQREITKLHAALTGGA